jgi:hypothetical protein
MNPITEIRFEALAGYTRRPAPTVELEWYQVQDERILGILLLEFVDEDFYGVALGRDRNRQFRWIDMTEFFDDPDRARDALDQILEQQSHETDESFEQGDEVRWHPPMLTPLVWPEEQHPFFRTMIEDERYSPAAGLIAALSPYFRDIDGNFVQQFQTSAFEPRLFEMYLFATLHEIGYAFDQSEAASDFHGIGPGFDIFVEATTVQPTQGGAPPPPPPETREEVIAYADGYGAIKYGSALFSKLCKRYWERPHVCGKPLLFAIQDFHAPRAMMVTSTALANYLYGWRHTHTRDEQGRLVINADRFVEHRHGDKVIPSNFFAQPGAEHVSAVIHNPHATLPKFNRMGALAGFGSPRVRLIRTGSIQDHNPNASEPLQFEADVRDPNYSERWTEGLSVYHNPRPLHPIGRDLFHGAAHHYISNDGQMESYTPDFFPMASSTLTYLEGEGAGRA